MWRLRPATLLRWENVTGLKFKLPVIKFNLYGGSISRDLLGIVIRQHFYMLYFIRCRAFSFKVEDLFGVGSIIGQARIKRTKPMTTIPIRLPM